MLHFKAGRKNGAGGFTPAPSDSAKGFTLIELLIVVAVLGLMASVILVSIREAREKSRDAKRVADMHQIAKALELYYDKYNRYPALADPNESVNWTNLIILLQNEKMLAQDFGGLKEKGLTVVPTTQAAGSIPQDPSYPAQSYGYMVQQYPANMINQGYRLRVKLEGLSHPALRRSLTGLFIDAHLTTGSTACDASLGYYCIGTVQVFYPFPV